MQEFKGKGEVSTKSLTQDFLREIVSHAEKTPHDSKFPFIEWYSKEIKKWFAERPDTTFKSWIFENTRRIKENREWKEFFTLLSLFTGAGIGLAIALLGAPMLLLAIPFICAAANVFVSLWKGSVLNRDIEGRSYFLKSMEDKVQYMIADLEKRMNKSNLAKKTKDGSSHFSVKESEEIQSRSMLNSAVDSMKEFKKDHYNASVFTIKWAGMGCRKGFGYAISFVRILFASLVIVGLIAPVALPVTLSLLGVYVAIELLGALLYEASHSKRDRLMENNARQIDNSLNKCMELYKKYENIQSLEDLQSVNLISKAEAKETLKKLKLLHECNHHDHHHEGDHSCEYHHKHKHSHDDICKEENDVRKKHDHAMKFENLMQSKGSSFINHIHTHWPRGQWGKPVQWYSMVTQAIGRKIEDACVKTNV